MVSPSHLSGGNSLSSPSRDLFAEFGISNPSSPTMVESDMAASGAFPLDGSLESDDSDANSAFEANMGLGHGSAMKEIFLAAQQLTHNDRSDAADGRRKCQTLMAFIAAHGFSSQEVNDFAKSGEVSRKAGALHMFDKSPLRPNAVSPEAPPVPSSSRMGDMESQPKLGCDVPRHVEGVQPLSPVVPPSPLKQSWCSVVAQGDHRPGLKLEYHPPHAPTTADGSITIKPPAEILLQGNSLWNSCLAGSFLHSRLPFKLVEESVHKLWDKYGLQKVYLQDKGLFIFKFSSPADRDNVLALGPWYISNKLLCLKPWKEGMDLQFDSCTKAPVWVKFHNIPMSYLSPAGLSFIASGVGKPLFVDKVTEKLEPMNFAKICIEVTTSSPMPSSLNVVVMDEDSRTEKVVVVKVEYLNRPQSCSHCKSFGHSLLRCPKANYKWVPKVTAVLEPGPPAPVPPPMPDDLGSSPPDAWTVVAKGPKQQAPPSIDSVSPSPPINSFELLSTLANVSPDNFSDTDATPSPNPLVGKLKVIDEKAVKDLKNKASSGLDQCQSSMKKKSKGGGGIHTPT